MYLKKLELHGFKSFADKTALHFDPGVTAIVGPNGCGKCLTGDALVTLADGRAVPIRDLVDDALEAAGVVETLDDGTLTLDNPHGVTLLSLDPETLRLGPRPVAAFVKREAPENLLRVRTRSGREVTATPYHPLFTLKDGRLHALRADELEEGIRIAVPRQLPVGGVRVALHPDEAIARFDRDDRVYVPPSARLMQWVRDERDASGSSAAWSEATGVAQTRIKGALDGQAINAAALAKLARAASTPPPLTSALKSRTTGTLRLPDAMTPELARFLGLLVAEGRNTESSQVWFVNSDAAVNDDYQRLAKRLFGVEVHRKQYKSGAEDLLIYSQVLGKTLERLFRFSIGSASAGKEIPPQLLKADDEARWAFLSGLFEGDAYVSAGVRPNKKAAPPYIEFCSASLALARQVVSLLLRLGLFALLRPKQKYASNTEAQTKRTYYSVYLYGTDQLRHAAEHLRFAGKKQRALGLLAALPEASNPNHDVVPGATALVRAATRAAGLPVKAHRRAIPKLAAYSERRCEATRGGLAEVAAYIARYGATPARAGKELAHLRTLTCSDVYWDEVVAVEEIAPPDPWVYDLCVADTHNFVANDIVVHNSNVVDAVRWVVGEQRARVLRSEQMQNVIFNGTSKRRPLGLSEVMLTIENTRGVLPTEYTEVTLGRRLYRSGQSEYLLNGTTCRLKDITDLFMDTGMGAGAYSVIELKMVEEILSENADDRRRLFEEAAGVTKYKLRRAQTLRKLGGTQADLTRVRDLTDEVEQQVRRLKRQAKRAERYKTAASRLRILERALARHEYAALSARAAELREAAAAATDAEAQASAKLAEAEAALEAERAAQAAQESAAREAREALASHLDAERRLETDVKLGRERLATAQRDRTRTEEEQQDAADRLAALAHTLSDLNGQLDAARPEAEAAEARQQEAAEALGVARRDAQAARAARDAADRARRDADRALADARRQEDRLASRLDLLRSDHARATADQAPVRERAAEAQRAAEESARARDAARAEAESAREAEEAAAREESSARQALDAATSARRDAERAHDAARAEADLLRRLVASYDDLPDAVQHLASTQPSGQPLVTVADVLACDEPHRVALDAALGDMAACIVVENAADAARALAQLRAEGQGQATFALLDSLDETKYISPPTPHSPPSTPHTQPLRPLVRTSAPRYEALADALLGRWLLAPSLDAAPDLPPGARAVTPEGEWRQGRGVMHGGSARKTASPVAQRLSRAEELAALDAELAALARDLEDRQAHESAARAALEAAGVDAARRASREAAQTAARADAAHARAEAEARSAAGRLASLSQRADRLAEDIAEGEAETGALASASERAAAAQRDADAALAQATTDAQHADAALRESEQVHSEAHLARVQASHRRETLQRDADRAASARADLARRSENLVRRRAGLADAIAAGTAALTEQDAALAALRDARPALEAAVRDGDTALSDLHARQSDLDAALRTLRRDRDTHRDALHKAEVGLAEVETRRTDLLETAQEEYGTDLADPSLQSEPWPTTGDDDAPFEVSAARREVSELRRAVRTMGPVNELALEQYEAESERFAFLSEQLADLESAEATLKETIDEINTTATERFRETFAEVQQHFSRLFTELFGGDAQATVFLADPDDPLESPIDVTARPRGKRPSGIAQLSGGEKTLTATALLFAIYLVKPSPFCILDEVDAPLDDANVDRFMHLIRAFSKDTQFILVTHNKRSMELADRMYGITMQEQGVSQLVGVRFEEAAALAEES